MDTGTVMVFLVCACLLMLNIQAFGAKESQETQCQGVREHRGIKCGSPGEFLGTKGRR